MTHSPLLSEIRLANDPGAIEARCKQVWELSPADCCYLINVPRTKSILSWESLSQEERNALTLSLLTVRMIAPKVERVFSEAAKADITSHLDQQLESVLGAES